MARFAGEEKPTSSQYVVFQKKSDEVPGYIYDGRSLSCLPVKHDD